MEHSSRLKQLLVPVDGSTASLEALSLACSLGKRNKGTVYTVYVIEVARSLPLDAELGQDVQQGEDILSAAEKVAEELDCPVEGELLQARDAGHAIVDESIERNVDAIIMGVDVSEEGTAYDWPERGKPRALTSEPRLGHVAQYILQNARCQVWLIRLARETK